ncbi:OB-fold protein [Sideroxydans sp.]
MRFVILLCSVLLWSGLATATDTSKYTLSADQLYSEYESNEVSADNRYKGKQVIISGTIQQIANDYFGHPYVLLGSGVMDGVQCSFPDSRKSSLIHLSKGQKVTIKGTVQGMSIFVQLNNAELSKKTSTVHKPKPAEDSQSKVTQQEATRCYMLGLIYSVIGANRDAGKDIGTALYDVQKVAEWDNSIKREIASQMYNNPKFTIIDGDSMGEHMRETCLKHPAFVDLTDPDSP